MDKHRRRSSQPAIFIILAEEYTHLFFLQFKKEKES